jgi:cellulose synthase/poly-beta-1,6-N-acetylglucosamine synthase-like glycosyltransferase
MRTPIVSIIVPVYNNAATIARCIESLLAQTYPADLTEIIIVNNNSGDNTTNIVGVYPVKLVHETIQTSYAARNRGIRAAQGSIVSFIDADCVADRQWLSHLMEPFKDERVGAIAGSILPDTSDSLVERFTNVLQPFEVPTDLPLEVLLTNNVAYRKDLVERVGLFDEALFTAGDVDLGWRVQIHTGAQVKRVPDAIVYHKHRSTFKGLFKQYRRYGFSEVLLDTLYKGSRFHSRAPQRQLGLMLRQLVALITYLRSMIYRRVVVGLSLKSITDQEFYLTWPVVYFVAEAGSLIGKVDALIATRGFRQNPFSSRAEIRRVYIEP